MYRATTAPVGNKVMTLTPSGNAAAFTAGIMLQGMVRWTCTSELQQKYLPSTCTSS